MFVETKRADREAEGNIIRVQNDALRKITDLHLNRRGELAKLVSWVRSRVKIVS